MGKQKSYKWKYGGRRPFFLSFIKTRLHNFYSIRRPWRNAETSPTAPCAPLASIPDRPPPSSRLVRRRMPLVQPKSAGKCLNTIHLARASVVEPKPMATPETSHAAAIDPLTPQPSQPTPSPRLRQRRVRLVLMKCRPAAPCRRRAARRRCRAA